MPIDVLNKACFEYLAKFPPVTLQDKDLKSLNRNERDVYRQIITLLKQQQINSANYEKDLNYKEIYQKLHELAENLQLYSNDLPPGNLKTFHNKFFIALFENDNKIHTEINKKVIQPRSHSHTSDLTRIKQNQKKLTKKSFGGFSHPEHIVNRFFSGLLGINYHPLKTNNVPYISFEHPSKEQNNLRFGAQINGLGTVNRSFTQYLAVKKAQRPEKKYNHVYINLQKRDMNEGGKFERFFERTRSLALEELENRKDLGIAVLTLPADSRFFFSGFSHSSGLSTSDQVTLLSDLKNHLVSAINNNTHDFYISDEVKKVIFGDKTDPIITELFSRAAKDILGPEYDPNLSVDPAIRQAILFHFVKFHLTDHILKQLHPDNYNISCKDNIDRGGAHNLWYEFNLKIRDTNEKISLEAFQTNLDASALLVKGRPMNDHRNVIWNTLYQQFIHNPQKTADRMPWVGDWLAKNIPLSRSLEKQLENPASKIKLSKSEKSKYAVRLGKKAENITTQDVLNLMQKEVNERINHIHKAQNSIASNPVVLTTNSVQRILDPNIYVSALEKRFVATKVSVRNAQQIPNGQLFVIESPKLPPIHINHSKLENHDVYRTAFKFSPESLNPDQFHDAIKALTALAKQHAKKNPEKTFTITAKGNPAYAIALLSELQKHGLVGKLKDNEFNPQQQQAILSEVAKAAPARTRSASVNYLYTQQKATSRKPRSQSVSSPQNNPRPKAPKR